MTEQENQTDDTALLDFIEKTPGLSEREMRARAPLPVDRFDRSMGRLIKRGIVARTAIEKRPATPAAPKGRLRITTAADGHSHSLDDGLASGETSIADGEESGTHAHDWSRLESGKIVLGTTADHTHELTDAAADTDPPTKVIAMAVTKARVSFEAGLVSFAKRKGSTSAASFDEYVRTVGAADYIAAHPPAPDMIAIAKAHATTAASLAAIDHQIELAAADLARDRAAFGEQPYGRDAAIAAVKLQPAGAALVSKRAAILESSVEVVIEKNAVIVDLETSFVAAEEAHHKTLTEHEKRFGLKPYLGTPAGAELAKRIADETLLHDVAIRNGGARALELRKQLHGMSTTIEKKIRHEVPSAKALRERVEGIAKRKGISMDAAYEHALESDAVSRALYNEIDVERLQHEGR